MLRIFLCFFFLYYVFLVTVLNLYDFKNLVKEKIVVFLFLLKTWSTKTLYMCFEAKINVNISTPVYPIFRWLISRDIDATPIYMCRQIFCLNMHVYTHICKRKKQATSAFIMYIVTPYQVWYLSITRPSTLRLMH